MTKTVTTGKATDLITFTRSTTGTYLDSVKYGDELVTNGTFDNNLDGWSGAGWVWSDGKAYDSGPTVTDGLEQIIPTVANAYYVIEYTLSGISGGTPSVQFRGQSAAIHDSDVTNGRVIVQALAATSKVEIIGGAATFYIHNISVKEIIGNQGTSGEPLLRTADTNEPRIEYDADGNLKGLLIEEQRSNLFTNSNNADVLEVNGLGITTAANSNEVQAPSNTETVIKLNKTASGYGYARKSYTTVTSAQTFSVFVKRGTARYVGLRQLNTSGSHQHTAFDLETKTWTHTGYSHSRGYQDYGDGWLRLWVTDNSNTKSWASVAIVGADGNENNGQTGTLYVYGFQREAGTFPTSYIPTLGSTVTRNADVATINVSEFEYNHTESTILVEGEKTARNTSSTGVFTFVALHDGGSSDRVLLYYNNTRLRGQVKSENATVAQFTGDTAEGGKLALAYELNHVTYSDNGNTVFTDISAPLPVNLQIFSIGGYSYSTAQQLNGHIKSVKYYPLKLTDNQLKALTQ